MGKSHAFENESCVNKCENITENCQINKNVFCQVKKKKT